MKKKFFLICDIICAQSRGVKHRYFLTKNKHVMLLGRSRPQDLVYSAKTTNKLGSDEL